MKMWKGQFGILGISRILLRVLLLINLALCGLLLAILIGTWIFDQTFRNGFADQPGIDPDIFLSGMRLCIAATLPLFAIIHLMLSRLLAIVETVRGGDPFVPENAARLRTIAWCMLAGKLAVLGYQASIDMLARAGLYIEDLARAGLDLDEMTGGGSSWSGWLAVLMLFVLARVFEVGSRNRADLEAMV